MKWYDYLLVIIIAILLILAIIYIIKHRGCPSSECAGCKYASSCNKAKKGDK